MERFSYKIWTPCVCVCVCVCGVCVLCVCARWGGGGPKKRWTGARKKKISVSKKFDPNNSTK